GAMFVGLFKLINVWHDDLRQPWIALSFGAPAVMWVLSTGMVLQIGLMGHDLYDASREWLGRLRAWIVIYSLAWLAFFAASIWGPYWIASVLSFSGWAGVGITALWVGTTVAGLIAGNAPKTSGTPAAAGKTAPSPIPEFVATIAPYV